MIASGGGLLGSAIGVIASARLTNYRIGQKVANHRIDDLEDLNK